MEIVRAAEWLRESREMCRQYLIFRMIIDSVDVGCTWSCFEEVTDRLRRERNVLHAVESC